MRWIDKDFAGLLPSELYAILALRQRVFIVEQRCLFVDADGQDASCHHLWAQRGDSILAYLRIAPPGSQFPEVSIGRVVTAAEVRGTGLGRELMQRGLSLVRLRHGPVPVRIGAQAHLERFYLGLGFARASEPYDEDGIEHIEMLKVGKVGDGIH